MAQHNMYSPEIPEPLPRAAKFLRIATFSAIASTNVHMLTLRPAISGVGCRGVFRDGLLGSDLFWLWS
jgi:hypothetical protein